MVRVFNIYGEIILMELWTNKTLYWLMEYSWND